MTTSAELAYTKYDKAFKALGILDPMAEENVQTLAMTMVALAPGVSLDCVYTTILSLLATSACKCCGEVK